MSKKRTSKKAASNKHARFVPSPAVGSAEFNKLQAKWYAKLEADGFEDIEWSDASTGLGQGTPYLKGTGNLPKTYKSETAFYFRMVSNFLVHSRARLGAEDRFILKQHEAGVSYRDIVRAFNKEFRARRSLFFIFYRLRKLRARVETWNREHAEGLLNPAQTDFYVSE